MPWRGRSPICRAGTGTRARVDRWRRRQRRQQAAAAAATALYGMHGGLPVVLTSTPTCTSDASPSRAEQASGRRFRALPPLLVLLKQLRKCKVLVSASQPVPEPPAGLPPLPLCRRWACCGLTKSPPPLVSLLATLGGHLNLQSASHELRSASFAAGHGPKRHSRCLCAHLAPSRAAI